LNLQADAAQADRGRSAVRGLMRAHRESDEEQCALVPQLCTYAFKVINIFIFFVLFLP
jgi:hypothetical protein